MVLGWLSGSCRIAGALLLAATMGIVHRASVALVLQLNGDDEDRAMPSGAATQLGSLGITIGSPLLALLIATIDPAGVIVFAQSRAQRAS